MSKKSSKKRQPDALPEPELMQDASPLTPRGTEKMMSDLMKLLNEQNFQSVAEANAFMKNFMAAGGRIPEIPAASPLEQAQEVMYRTFEARNPAERIHLAQQALKLSPDCADAYVLLAEETAPTLQAKKTLYEAGVKAGERVLGPEAFKDMKGHFWGFIETRPYMRARCGLAQCLWAMGEYHQAIEHFTALLQLNPGDNQGIRYLLVSVLLKVGDDKALDKLLKKYKDDYSATWKYTHALLAFKREGNSTKANRLLYDALAYNPHVPAYLLGKKRIPKALPPYMSIGDQTEAVHYALDAKPIWQKTEGALDWLKQAPDTTNTTSDSP
jgi:tetratricopeptide (TPR) repeat protein